MKRLHGVLVWVLVVFLGACTFTARTVEFDPAPAEQVVVTYLAALGDQEWEAAYDTLTEASKQTVSFDEFRDVNAAAASAGKSIAGFEIASVAPLPDEDPGERLNVIADLQFADDSSHTVGLTAANEGGRWGLQFHG